MTVVDSFVVTAVGAVVVSPFIVVIFDRSSVVVPSVGGLPTVGKAQGAQEGDDDEKKDGLGVHCVYEEIG